MYSIDELVSLKITLEDEFTFNLRNLWDRKGVGVRMRLSGGSQTKSHKDIDPSESESVREY